VLLDARHGQSSETLLIFSRETERKFHLFGPKDLITPTRGRAVSANCAGGEARDHASPRAAAQPSNGRVTDAVNAPRNLMCAARQRPADETELALHAFDLLQLNAVALKRNPWPSGAAASST
jgi:hypothetical protein